MKSIIPFLWFDDKAEEAVNFYTSLFHNSEKNEITYYDKLSADVSGRPDGSIMTIDFKLCGQRFAALNGGPMFHFNPSVSFFVECDSETEIKKLWNALSEGGEVLMPLEKYHFSEIYGWTADRFGLSWQISLSVNKQNIKPSLMFVKENFGKAEEAMNLYTTLFPDSEIKAVSRYQQDHTSQEGKIAYAVFTLKGHEFTIMESNQEHKFEPTQAVSFLVECENQDEVDLFWGRLTEKGEEQPCGWLKDRYGVSWQIVPEQLKSLLYSKDLRRSQNVSKVMFNMKKLDLNVLMKAYEEVEEHIHH